MFGKKKQPLPPFVLQVLTTEYLIEGTFEDDASLCFGHDEVAPLSLTSVQIQATGPVEIPTQTCAQFVVMGNNAVALIPRTEITQMAEYEFWKLYKKPLLGVFHVGPYVMQGRLMLQSDNHFQSQMPMFDVHIVGQVPGACWGELHAQFALVNFHWLQGYEPR